MQHDQSYTGQDFKKGISILDIIAPEDREKAIKNVQEILIGDDRSGNEYKLDIHQRR